MRELVRETVLLPSDFIYPIFVIPGEKKRQGIETLPGIDHVSADEALIEAKKAWNLGIRGIMLFGLPSYKDEEGSSAWDPNEPVQVAARMIKAEVPQLIISTDVCLCQYSSLGQCGVVTNEGNIHNDLTVKNLVKVALSHVEAGADIVAPSDMMDGRIGAMRAGLDEAGFEDRSILSYSVKYNSAYYGPFRAAADSAPHMGDRSTYQMDPANSREALREVMLDLDEGADMVMVKPGMPYLDICRRVKDAFGAPTFAYQVSGEYAMIMGAAERGWIKGEAAMVESLLAFKRAGCDGVLTYFAPSVARLLKG